MSKEREFQIVVDIYVSSRTLPWCKCPTNATFLMRFGLSIMSARNLQLTHTERQTDGHDYY